MANGFTEAPASWNVRYITPDGFSCQLILRGETGADLLPTTQVAIKWLFEHECYPSGGTSGNGNGGHDGEARQAPINRQPDAAGALCTRWR